MEKEEDQVRFQGDDDDKFVNPMEGLPTYDQTDGEKMAARISLLENEKGILLTRASELASENRELRSKLFALVD